MEEKFENNKGLIESRKSKKGRQYNGQKKMDKKGNNNLTKNWARWTSLKQMVNSGDPEGVGVSPPYKAPDVVQLATFVSLILKKG